MKTWWLAVALFSGCVCNVQVPDDCAVQGGACQGGGVSCDRVLEGLCAAPGDVCCWVPDAAGGGSAGGGTASGGGSGGGGSSQSCLLLGGACQPAGPSCGLVLDGACPSGETCCWVPDAAGGGSATGGGGGTDSTCPNGVGGCAPAATCPGTSLTQYTCGGDTVCCPLVQCDETTVTDFVNSHKTCSVDADCTAICMLGASCDDRAVNADGAAAFSSTFSTCRFPACNVACFVAHCTLGACSP